MGIVLDSTVLIAAERVGQNPRGVIENMLARVGDTEATLSIITVVELAHGIERANSAARQIARELFLNELLNEISVEPITIPIAVRAWLLDGNLELQGISIALGDLLIGATALEIGYAVVTNNVRHFQMIPELVVRQL